MNLGGGKLAAMAALAAAMSACDGKAPLAPQSGGEPYEVLLMADNDTALGAIKAMLELPIEGLPQREPSFDVSSTKGWSLNQATRYARCIVMAQTGDAPGGRTAIKYETDVYARPQLIVYVSSPSAGEICKNGNTVGRQLRRLIGNFEAKSANSALRRLHDSKAGNIVRETTGCHLTVPQGLAYSKRGKNFVWLTDNNPAKMRNICVYTYGGTDISPATIVGKRDSIMAANLPGESPGSHVTTETEAPIFCAETHTANGTASTMLRGLWKMEGGAMGGPFVCRAVADSAKGRTVVAEGFAYAPGKPKRSMMKQLEAALLTLQPN